MKVVGKYFHLCKYFLIAYNNKNAESQKQLVEKDDETANVASEDEENQELTEDHPVQNASNFSDHKVQNYYNDGQLFSVDWAIDNVSFKKLNNFLFYSQ